jgi:hypothetical protein
MVSMARQLNLNVTPGFERDLKALMKTRNFTCKSDAIRTVVREAAAAGAQPYDFRRLLGIGLRAPLNPKPEFSSEDDLWS